MARGAIVWQRSPLLIAAKCGVLERRFPGEVDRTCAKAAAAGQRFAQVNAPWTNQTGYARATLQGLSTVSGGEGEIILQHGADYGIWLELSNQGRYGILPAALEHTEAELNAGLEGLLGRVA